MGSLARAGVHVRRHHRTGRGQGGKALSYLATWQGRHVPALGVVILCKDDEITDADFERLMPFATQAGNALVRVSDAERLRDSVKQYAVEKDWLYWMVNGFADPVVLVDANNDIILQNLRAEPRGARSRRTTSCSPRR